MRLGLHFQGKTMRFAAWLCRHKLLLYWNGEYLRPELFIPTQQ